MGERSKQPLFREYPDYKYISVLLFLSLALLILGLFLPAIYLKQIVVFRSTFSVLTGIGNLFHEGYVFLGAIIFLFSVIFPFSKLFMLYYLWFFRVSASKQAFYIRWLGILGKWSMLDVFVVAITIVITKISFLADAEPRAGIYLFCASILLTMFTTEKIERVTGS